MFGLAPALQFFGDQVDPNLTPPVFKITASYSYSDRTVTEVTTIDVRPYRGSMPRSSSAVARELKTISKTLENMRCRQTTPSL